MLHKNIPYRRHQESKKKKWVRKKWSDWFGHDMPDKLVGITAKTPHPCSGICCGNRRKYEGKTLDEIRNELDLKDEIKEIEEYNDEDKKMVK